MTGPEQLSPQHLRPDRYRARRRLPRWAVVLLVLAAVVVLAVVAAVGLFVWALSGAWDGLRGQADPSDRQVVAARREARGSLDTLTARALGAVGASVAGREAAKVRYDQCRQGQNNWKIHDGYTLRCELSDSVVARPASGDVTSVAARLDAGLRGDGWAPTGVRDEMTQDARAGDASVVLTRTGAYHRPDDDRLTLTVVVTVRPDHVWGDLPYDPGVRVEGDLDAYRRALQGPDPTPSAAQPGRAPAPRIVVHTSVRYFEDD